MDDSSDSDLISSITPDVMASLHRSRFFGQLDDLLSPLDGSEAYAKQCSGDYKLSEGVLRLAGYASAAVKDIFDVLRSQGDAGMLRLRDSLQRCRNKQARTESCLTRQHSADAFVDRALRFITNQPIARCCFPLFKPASR